MAVANSYFVFSIGSLKEEEFHVILLNWLIRNEYLLILLLFSGKDFVVHSKLFKLFNCYQKYMIFSKIILIFSNYSYFYTGSSLSDRGVLMRSSVEVPLITSYAFYSSSFLVPFSGCGEILTTVSLMPPLTLCQVSNFMSLQLVCLYYWRSSF